MSVLEIVLLSYIVLSQLMFLWLAAYSGLKNKVLSYILAILFFPFGIIVILIDELLKSKETKEELK